MRLHDLNFRHVLYFWTVVREGSVTAAAEALHVTQPTVSAQLRVLEDQLGTKLLRREGRGVVPTEAGTLVARYADEIFDLGRELIGAVKGYDEDHPLHVTVGIADVVPRLVSWHLLEPILALDELRIEVRVGHPDELLADLSIHKLDVVIADSPIGPGQHIRAFNHLLGRCPVAWYAAPAMAAQLREDFPRSLEGAPCLLPTRNTVLRRSLEHWFDTIDVQPLVRAEFEDSTFLKVFGNEGLGAFPAPAVIADDIVAQYDLEVVGLVPEVEERFYAISTERRLANPAVVALSRAARSDLFDEVS